MTDDHVDADPDLALQVFLAATKEDRAQLSRAIRHARQWQWFWFTCWALSIPHRIWP